MDDFIDFIFENNIAIHMWHLDMSGCLIKWKFPKRQINKLYEQHQNYKINYYTVEKLKSQLKIGLTDYNINYFKLQDNIKSNPELIEKHIFFSYLIQSKTNKRDKILKETYELPSNANLILGKIDPITKTNIYKKRHIKKYR